MTRPRSHKCNLFFIFPLFLCHGEPLDMLLQLLSLSLYYFCLLIDFPLPWPRLHQIEILSLPEKQNVIMLNFLRHFLVLILFCVMCCHWNLTKHYLIDWRILWDYLWLWPEMLLLRIGNHLWLECTVLWLILYLGLPFHLQFMLSWLLPYALALVYWQAFLGISDGTIV